MYDPWKSTAFTPRLICQKSPRKALSITHQRYRQKDTQFYVIDNGKELEFTESPSRESLENKKPDDKEEQDFGKKLRNGTVQQQTAKPSYRCGSTLLINITQTKEGFLYGSGVGPTPAPVSQIHSRRFFSGFSLSVSVG